MVFDAEEEWSNEDAEVGVQMGRSSLPLHVAFSASLLRFFYFIFTANSSGFSFFSFPSIALHHLIYVLHGFASVSLISLS